MHNRYDRRSLLHRAATAALLAGAGLLSAGCVPSGGSAGAAAPTQVVASVAPVQLSGSVGDGPVQGATVTVTDAGGQTRAQGTSDGSAKYALTVPAGTGFPVRIAAASGTDVVSGAAPGFTLVSVALSPDQRTANLTPITTLIVRAAEAMPGGLTSANVSTARRDVLANLSFGLDPAQVADPITTPVAAQNVAGVIRANEALAELIRRTHDTLVSAGDNVSEDRIVDALADDVSDGTLDGRGAAGTDPRISATARVAAAQILVETLSGHLRVGGVDATSALNSAVQLTTPGAPASATMTAVAATDGALAEARRAIRAAQAVSSAPVLGTLLSAVAALPPGTSPQAFAGALPSGAQTQLASAVTAVGTASSATFDSINTVANAPLGLPAPSITLSANPVSISSGASSTLTWSVTDATSCTASGGWGGARATVGSASTGPLTATTTYTLKCNGPGGSASAAASVTVTAAPSAPAPSATLVGGLTVLDTAHAGAWSVQSNLQSGAVLYGDRAYTVASLPSALAGSAWIRTANDSRQFTGSVVARFTVASAATVYVAYRDDITTRPTWLQSWTDSGLNLTDSEPKTYSLYRKDFTAGSTVDLGPNGSGTSGMYTVVVTPTAASGSGTSTPTPAPAPAPAPSPSPTPTPTVNHIPVAVDDTASTPMNSAVSIAVLANDSGLQDVPVTVTVISGPAHGTTTVNADGTVQYSPATDFAGTDLFTYQVRDANGDIATATVTVTVTCATCSTKTLTLSWDPSPQTVLGYHVYYGTTSSAATTLARNIPVGTSGFNAAAPSVQFNAWNDLRLRVGDTACFRVTAYNAAGESGASTAVCGGL